MLHTAKQTFFELVTHMTAVKLGIRYKGIHQVRSKGRDKKARGGGVLLGILGGGVPPGSSNPDPISDLNMPFSTPIFRPDL